MGRVLFILFAVIEIGLAVLTCTKQREKSGWYRNRALFTAAELVILILSMLTAGNKWRFVGCAAVIAVRLVFSGIGYLAKKKKAIGTKSKAGAVFSAVMSTLFMGLSLVPAVMFSGHTGFDTTGEYSVKTTEAILVDSSRVETYETDGSNREVPVHFYYPDGNAENCPFVLFDHGSFGYYQSNDSLYQELASNGYVVASIDHPYYAFFTTDTDGKTIIVDMGFINSVIDCENGKTTPEEDFRLSQEWLTVRAADLNFVLDSIISAKADNALGSAWNTGNSDEILRVLGMADMDNIGLMGHSIGGAAAVKLGRERSDISAVIDIDGTMSSERTDFADGKFVYNDTAYPVPLLALDNERHGTYYKESPLEDMDYINKHVLDNALDGRERSFEGTEHLDFTDLPAIAPGIAKNILNMSSADAEEFIPQLNGIILNYFNYYLKGEGELTVAEWD